MKIFVDLDRTLLNTDLFVEYIWNFLAAEYQIDPVTEKAKASRFYTYTDDLYDYDFFEHIRTLGLATETVTSRLISYLRDQFLLFDDSLMSLVMMHRLGDVTVLTFGNEEYQRFKLSAVPELQTLPVIVVRDHKSRYFTQIFTDPCVLIDDKNVAHELPSNVSFILLDRGQFEPLLDHGTYKSIRDLSEITHALEGMKL